MIRDMDLIRDILLRIEEHNEPRSTVNMTFNDRDEQEVMGHVKLLCDEGFVEAFDESAASGGYYYSPTVLTWQGHEFLDAARNQNVWNSAKEAAAKYGGPIPLEILKALLMKTAMSYLGLPG